MKLLFLSMFLVVSCGAKSKPSEANFDLDHERQDRAESFDISTIERCDRLTFAALVDAFGRPLDLTGFEYPAGLWHRDVQPCPESGTETSKDAYLSVIHSQLTRGDHDGARRVVNYAKPLGWVTSPGNPDVTSIGTFSGLFVQYSGLTVRGEDDSIAALAGFRGHLLATYIFAKGRMEGKISAVYLEVLRGLSANSPENPYFMALYHRFSDGDQTQAEDMLSTFPHGTASTGWGSCPDDVLFFLTMAAIKGE